MLKHIISYFLPMFILCGLCFIGVSIYLPEPISFNAFKEEPKKFRIGIATNASKERAIINTSAIQILQELSEEFAFEFIQIESGENLEWVYNVGEIHEETPLDLLIGVGWEASEIFPIIYSKYDDLRYIVIDNKVEFPYIKSVFFSRYDCSYIIGAMMATAFPKEKELGFISNFDTAYTQVYLEGYIDGIHSINPHILVQTSYTKKYDNVTAAYDVAKEQNELGIKFAMSILSPKANEGVYQYAKESQYTDNPFYTTCIGIDETTENKPFILTGITENLELALRLVISDFLYHGYTLNTVRLGLEDNGVDVLLGSTLDIQHRNQDIMTDEVLAAGREAFRILLKKNAHTLSDGDNQIYLYSHEIHPK